MKHIRYGRLKTVAAVLSIVASAVMLNVAASAPAQAASSCHRNSGSVLGAGEVEVSFGSTGDMKYPATLHGRKVRLFTDSGNASAYAVALLQPGDILSIDRSNFEVRGPRSDHNWLTTSEVQARGDWDYCEVTGPGSQIATPRIDGAHRAVRVCLRHNGGLQCTNIWYADNDDDKDDWI
jgi:hypothetical protein